MATYHHSPFGKVKGKLGEYIGQGWKSLNVVKRAPTTYNDANTVEQQNNRTKLRVLSQIAKMFGKSTKVGFKNEASSQSKPMTERNVFISKNYEQVLVEQNHDPIIDWVELINSSGPLETDNGTLAATLTGNQVTVTWDKSNDPERDNDKVYITLRIQEIAGLIDQLAQKTRSQETSTITLPATPVTPFNVWIFFRDPLTGAVSNSHAITVTP